MKRNLILALLLLIIASFVLVSCDDNSTPPQQPMGETDRAVIDRIFVDIEAEKKLPTSTKTDLKKAKDEFDKVFATCQFDMGSESGAFFAHATGTGSAGRMILNNLVIQNDESDFIYTLTGSFSLYELASNKTDYSEQILFTEVNDVLKIVIKDKESNATKEINLSKLDSTTGKTNIGEVEGLLEPQAKEIISGLYITLTEYRDEANKKGITFENENIVVVSKLISSISSGGPTGSREYEYNIRLKSPVVINGNSYTIELKYHSIFEVRSLPYSETSIKSYPYEESTYDYNVTINGKDTIKASITEIFDGKYPSAFRETLTVNSMEINGKKLFADEVYGYLLKKIQYLKAALEVL